MSSPLRNDDPWYVTIVATRVEDQRSYTTVITTRNIEKLIGYINAPSPPLISRCIAHPIGNLQHNSDQPLFEGDDYTDTESDDGALEEEAQVKEDIARQYAEIQQIQLYQQQQLPTPTLPPPPSAPLNRPLENGESSDPVFRRAIALFSRQEPLKAYPQSVLPGAPHDWVARTNASVSLEISLAMARVVSTGTSTPAEAARRFDHLRKSLADESRARNPRQPLYVQALDQLRRKQETLRKKRKTNEEAAAEREEPIPEEGDEEDTLRSRPPPQHIALLRMRRSQNGHVSSLAVVNLPQADQSARPRTNAPHRNKLIFAAGPFVNYQDSRSFSMAVSSVRGDSQRIAEAVSLAERSHIPLIPVDLKIVLGAEEGVFVYRGTAWSGVPPDKRAKLLASEKT